MKNLQTLGNRISDFLTKHIGSWPFVGLQTGFILFWLLSGQSSFLLNLLLSLQGAYAVPILLMASNRITTRDHLILEDDFRCDQEMMQKINSLQAQNDELKMMILELHTKFIGTTSHQRML